MELRDRLTRLGYFNNRPPAAESSASRRPNGLRSSIACTHREEPQHAASSSAAGPAGRASIAATLHITPASRLGAS